MTATVTAGVQDDTRRGLSRIGISFPTPIPANGPPVTGRELIEGAQRIEALGFHGIWMADVIGRGYFAMEPLTGLAAIAGATQRVELGTCILQVPLSEPVMLARRALTAALAANGRLVLGVGAGSTATDFQTVGGDFDQRFNVFDASLSTMRALWRGEQVGKARLDPWPAVVGGPPVLIGTWGGKWIERAATEFDGWVGSGAHATWEKVESAIKRFRAAGGRRAVIVSVIANLDGDSTAGPEDSVNLRCPPDEALRRLRRLAELGFDDVVVMSANRDAGHVEAIAELFRG